MSGSTASAYDNANKPTVALQNPLDVYRQYVGVQNALNETKLFQARQAAGVAFRNSLNPDGTPNQLRLNQNLAADPTTSPVAQQSAQAGQTLDSDTQDTLMKRLTGLNAAAMGLVAQYPHGVPKQAALDELDRVGPTLGLSPQQIAQAKASFGDDPTVNSRIIIRNGMQNLQAQDALHAARPGTGTQTGPGGVTVGIQTGPTAGDNPGAVSVPPQAGAPQGLTAAERAELVEVTDNNPSSPTYGQKFKVRRDSLSGAAGPEPANTSPLGTGRLPPALLKPPAATPAAAPQPPPGQLPGGASPSVPAGASPAGLAPGSPEEMQGSAQHAVVARDRANGYQQRIQPVEGALTALAGADTGRASEVLNNLRANVQDITPAFLQKMLPGAITDPAKRIAFEEANKYLTGIAINAPGGARSDAGQAAAGAASPSVHISNAAATQVARAILAQQRLEQAGTLAFNKSGEPGQNFDRFMNAWNTNADPRAFIADKMSKSERADLVKSLGGVGSAAYQKFKQSYQDGVDTGVVAGHGG